jgi:hypothetical protein
MAVPGVATSRVTVVWWCLSYVLISMLYTRLSAASASASGIALVRHMPSGGEEMARRSEGTPTWFHRHSHHPSKSSSAAARRHQL